ncbi:MAG: hypothetical protein KDB61_00755 [Planctomycetes bacterium]|nr:hypothetical protein [Planctomycetota bacterium]
MDPGVQNLLITVAIETGCATLWAAKCGPKDLPWVAACANLVTQPVAQLLVQPAGFWPNEVVVVLSEAVLFRNVSGLRWRSALLLSGVANAITIALALAR